MLNAAEDNEWLLLQNTDRNAELERQVMQTLPQAKETSDFSLSSDLNKAFSVCSH